MGAILTVKNLSVTLDGRRIVHDIHFSLEKGESLAVIGPNGSGKSVLMRTLLGMVPHQGEIIWGEKRRIGYVPQKIEADRHLPLNFQNLFDAKRDILQLSKSAIEEIIGTVMLPSAVLQTPVGHLSGGEFQKCLIAFALIGKPSLLILDEPTASIDQPREAQVYELLHRLQDEYGLTAIVVSHDLNFVYRYATSVLCLNEKNICFGKPHDVLTPDVLEKLYGAPMTYYHHLH